MEQLTITCNNLLGKFVLPIHDSRQNASAKDPRLWSLTTWFHICIVLGYKLRLQANDLITWVLQLADLCKGNNRTYFEG